MNGGFSCECQIKNRWKCRNVEPFTTLTLALKKWWCSANCIRNAPESILSNQPARPVFTAPHFGRACKTPEVCHWIAGDLREIIPKIFPAVPSYPKDWLKHYSIPKLHLKLWEVQSAKCLGTSGFHPSAKQNPRMSSCAHVVKLETGWKIFAQYHLTKRPQFLPAVWLGSSLMASWLLLCLTAQWTS